MSDEELDTTLAELRWMAHVVDPVPPAVREDALAAFGRRSAVAEVIPLRFDSWAHDRPLAGVRGAPGPRHLVFQSEELAVEVEVEGTTPRSLIGQLVPALAATVEIDRGDTTVVAVADDVGRFSAELHGGGPIRLVCRPGGGAAAMATDWVAI